MESEKFHHPKIFQSQQSCFRFLIVCRWPRGFICNDCAHSKYWVRLERKKIICKECRKEYSPTAGSLMHKSHLPIQYWLLATYWMGVLKDGISAKELQRQLKLGSYQTAWKMLHKLRNQISIRTNKSKETPIGSRVVELQVYQLGNHIDWVVGALEQYEIRWKIYGQYEKIEKRFQSRFANIANLNDFKLEKFIAENIRKNVTVHFYTDEIELNPKISGYNILRKPLGLPSGISVRKLPDIQKYFLKLSRWLNYNFHGVDRKYLQLYVNEFSFKLNTPANKVGVVKDLLELNRLSDQMS